tara:strand:- start:279 stop:695 length:417 start_codon:yes stop_codon:yes gene_type:complete
MTLTMLTGCSLKSLITPAATVTGAAVGSIGGPGGAALGAGAAYAGAELWTLDDENKKLVTAITTGDVKGIVAAQMKTQEGKIQEVTSGIWSTLKYAALVILGVLILPLIWTRSNSKKINAICEETKNGKTDKTLPESK